MRSLLFVPAIRPRFIEKAPTAGADVICLDLEDSVPAAEKPGAPGQARAALDAMPTGPFQRYVRVNGLDTGLTEMELFQVVGPGLDGISLPKVAGPEDIRQVDAYLTLLENVRGLPVGMIRIIPWIETAAALTQATAICQASPRLAGASIGGEDFTADMGIERTGESAELDHVRWIVSIACRAAGILAIDTPEPDFSDTAKLQRDCERSRRIGFRARWCIHPSQVSTVNATYQPPGEELAWARKVVEAWEVAAATGIGAVAVDGVMVDVPVVKRARKILEMAGEAFASD